MSRTRQVPSNTASSSHIQLLSPAVPQENHSSVRISGTLRLRAENDSIATDQIEDATPGRHIRWTEDVVDNEGMGKKSSKGESSSESEDSTSSSSESESDNDVDCRDPIGRAQNHKQNAQDASQSPSNPSLNRGRTPSCRKRHARRNGKRKPSPNAYEKMPKVKGQPRNTGL
ncbi:protein phosphatase 1 regulatory subunit Ypi1p [Aspergillus novofumigatus IBT 16806]|uniref:Protein phosphatase 1 regulatory subunit Ypi1p n=1 Tax=Aspergillus novofumigatus (strain IBT 16806) TaxID=1392255 RepID=A0A2I1CA74_ASPN1|nr:protein phosphatase 1 regulatory subunit Ypi1p [Aspergillus novofumigatus IBT 16806]PKX94496.1 protein phosphatase 1 regulatory subunit Ypi1p [Aspergillus novofumigatus IBT 16806]